MDGSEDHIVKFRKLDGPMPNFNDYRNTKCLHPNARQNMSRPDPRRMTQPQPQAKSTSIIKNETEESEDSDHTDDYGCSDDDDQSHEEGMSESEAGET